MAVLGGLRSDLKCRPICDNDLDQVIDCLVRGFPSRDRLYWVRALERLSSRRTVDDCPRYGHILTTSGKIVGVVLEIFSRCRHGNVEGIRCNLSSWCVDPAYRSYAVKMAVSALSRADVTYTTISPDVRTWSAIEALGFRRFCNGQFLFAPALSPLRRRGAVHEYAEGSREAALLSPNERRLLREHAALGCQSLICVDDNCAFPFVFVRRRMAKGLAPGRQLIYCRSIAELAQWAGSIGRLLLRQGAAVCVVDANGPIAGLVGRYRPERNPKYFKGPFPPALGDLSFTELAILGP
jgi:hypothetical protein